MPHLKVRTDPMSIKTDVDMVPIRLMGGDHKQYEVTKVKVGHPRKKAGR